MANDTLSPWIRQALSIKAVTPTQLQTAFINVERLQKIGLRKTHEEVLLIMGAVSLTKFREIAAHLESHDGVRVPVPKVSPLSKLSDSEMVKSWSALGPNGIAKIEECRDLQKRLEKVGLRFPLWEIAEARGVKLPFGGVPKAAPIDYPAPDLSKAETTKLWIQSDRKASRVPLAEPPESHKELLAAIVVGSAVIVLGFVLFLVLRG